MWGGIVADEEARTAPDNPGMTDLNDLLKVRAALTLTLVDGPIAADHERDPVLIFQIVKWEAKKIPRPFGDETDDGYEITSRVDTPDTLNEETPLAWADIRVPQATLDESVGEPVAALTSMFLDRWASDVQALLSDAIEAQPSSMDGTLAADDADD